MKSWKDMLEQTFADRKISRTEKKALREILEESSEQEKLFFRKAVFEMASSHIKSNEHQEILLWLEELISLSISIQQGSSSSDSCAYFSPGESCKSQIIFHLKSAQSKIDVCVFTITDNEISKEIEAAYRRKIALRIITDNDKAFDEGSDIQRLEQMGIFVRKDKTPLHMHHKFAIFDEKILLTGSYNWTRGAAEQQENLLVTKDKKLILQYAEEFENLWKQFQ
jgi:phosphatidylserine/phosphatidylglycerophosphate/cardiolipin synthase-like enzyme